MRWDELFADLEARAQALSAAERAAEIEDRTRYEAGRIRLADRLRPAVGTAVLVRCLGSVLVTGKLRRAHREWLLVTEPAGNEALIACAAIVSVGGLGRLSEAPETERAVDARLGLRYALRSVVRDRSTLRLHLCDGATLDGTLDRVGADFVEIAVHAAGEPRRRAEVREVLTVPVNAVAAVRRQR